MVQFQITREKGPDGFFSLFSIGVLSMADEKSPVPAQGRFNKSADGVPRETKTWSDGNLVKDYSEKTLTKPHSFIYKTFDRLECNECGSLSFEVLLTADYETTAQCISCGKYFVVHTG